VQDVPASWTTYLLGAQGEERRPDGLLLHAAGPTDEGFRVIDVWESRAAWERFRDRQPSGFEGPAHSTLRDLEVHDLYVTPAPRQSPGEL
jgi:hypothetical protein